MKATYGGMAGWFGPRNFATIEPMAGYIRATGLRRGSASRLAVCMTVFGSWLLCRQSTERMSVKRSSRAAIFGRCSMMRTPGSFVVVTPNGPRFSIGRSGLGSQVSIWLGPPVIQRRMTLLRPFGDWPAAAAVARWRNRPGTLSPARPARPALGMLRRLSRTRPSRSRALKWPKAWQRCIWPQRLRIGGPPGFGRVYVSCTLRLGQTQEGGGSGGAFPYRPSGPFGYPVGGVVVGWA